MQRDAPVLWVAGRYQPLSTSINYQQTLTDYLPPEASLTQQLVTQGAYAGLRDNIWSLQHNWHIWNLQNPHSKVPAALRDKQGVHYPLKSSRDCCAAAAGTGLASNPGLSHRTDLFCPRCWVLGRAAKSKVFMAPSESPSASQSYYEDVLWFEMSQRGMLGLLGC